MNMRPAGTIVLQGEFNDHDVEVTIVPAEYDPSRWELDEYPDLMNWTDAMEVVCANGYKLDRDGLIIKSS